MVSRAGPGRPRTAAVLACRLLAKSHPVAGVVQKGALLWRASATIEPGAFYRYGSTLGTGRRDHGAGKISIQSAWTRSLVRARRAAHRDPPEPRRRPGIRHAGDRVDDGVPAGPSPAGQLGGV